MEIPFLFEVNLADNGGGCDGAALADGAGLGATDDGDGVGDGEGDAVGCAPTVDPVPGRNAMTPAATTMTAAAAIATLAMVFMDEDLQGTRDARRCGIDGKAARTVLSTAPGEWSGPSSSQSAIR